MKIQNRILKVFLSVLAPVLIIVVWQVGSNLGKVNQTILPSPQKILLSFISLVQKGKLQSELWASIVRVLKGFAIGALLGIIIGILMGLFSSVYTVLNSLVSILRPIPMIAWVPLLILWTGIGETSKVAVIAIGAFWPTLLNTIHGIQTTDKKLLEVGLLLEKNKYVTLTKIIIPSALPSIFTGLKLGISTSWSCVVAAEMIAAAKGIGYMISYAREMGQPYNMFAGIITIGIIGLLIDVLLRKLQKRVLKWDTQEGK